MKNRISDDLTTCIGKTPLVILQNLEKNVAARIAVKLESFNLTGSVKDRAALFMLTDAEKRGLLYPGCTIIESTSGNLGISLSALCALKGYKLIITVPGTIATGHRNLLAAYGTELIITPGELGMQGAIQKAKELSEAMGNCLHLRQFDNPSNPLAHFKTTGPEIWQDTKGAVDVLVAGVGTGGTITGTGAFLKKKNPSLRIYAVEPAESAVLSGRKAGSHRIQGIGAGFVPSVLDRSLIDGVIPVKGEDAVISAGLLARRNGILAGLSSGAVFCGAMDLAARPENKGKLIVAVFPDGGEKYINMGLLS